MKPFAKVVTGGSHRDMGVDFGRAARDVIRDLVAESRGHWRHWTKGRDIAAAKRHANRHFLPAVARRYPTYLEEVRGIAEGAGVAFDDLFYLTADEELVELWSRPEKCSSAAVRAKQGMLLGHNEDYPPRYMDRLVIVDATPDDGPAFLALTYPYIVAGPSCGMTGDGLAFAVNSLRFPPRVKGVPTNYVLRDLYSCRTLADVPRVLRVRDALMGNAVVAVSAKEDAGLVAEARYGDVAIIRMGDADLLAHTNHVRSARLNQADEDPTWGSRKRCAALEHLLRRPSDRTRQGIQKALSSEEYGLMRHGRRGNDSVTVASAVLDPRRGMLYVAKRGPKGHGFKPYRLRR